MHPSTRFALTAVSALVLWSSSMLACLRGDLDLPTAGIRFVIAFVVAKLGFGVLDMLLTAYRRVPVAAPATAVTPVERQGPPLRRESDLAENGIVEVGAE